ncbi:SRPBCC domain-containing protein [Spirillospora sp. NPDC049652]
MFRFHRALAAVPGVVWRHLTDASLLARWWTPDALRVSELVFEARPGGRIVQEYRDAEDVDGTDIPAGRAEGTVEDVRPGERLVFRLVPELPGGGPAFTARIEMLLRPSGAGTDLDVRFGVTDSAVESADFVAGIELGFGQSLDRLVATLATHPAGDSDEPPAPAGESPAD